MKINHDKIISRLDALEKYSNVKINSEVIESMRESLEKYPGVLPLHIFFYDAVIFGRTRDGRRGGCVVYLDNLVSTGLSEELYDELHEERLVNHWARGNQLDGTIVEWVDKLQNHPELLSDAEREWVKNNPEYKKIIINE